MNHCLLCDGIIRHEPSFGQVFNMQSADFCKYCWQEFVPIVRAEHCERCCGRLGDEQKICEQCQYWERNYGWIVQHHALFQYNDAAKAAIHQIKFLGDIALIDGFIAKTNEYFRNNMKKKTITHIPSHRERLKLRKIDVIKHFCQRLDYPFENYLVKLLHTPHQSEQTKQERLELDYPFKACQAVEQDLIIIDDVYTTGATIYQAVFALQQTKGEKQQFQTFSLFR
ncbi:MAG: ComF family protein [Culicoidibacterales bacterium]